MFAKSLRAAFCVAVPFTFAAPALAASNVTFVSASGTNAGNCASPAAACRTFAYAIGQTVPGGEVKALTPGNYSPFAINKAITITGVPGAGVVQSAPAETITIAAGANDAVSLVGLSIDGAKGVAFNGVKLSSGGSLTIKNCIFRGFFVSGISLVPTAVTKFLIEDTTLTDLGKSGVEVMAASARNGQPAANGRVNRVSVSNASWTGVEVGGSNHVSITDSSVASSETGFSAAGNSKLVLAHSYSTQNLYGVVQVGANAIIESAGDNTIRDNVLVNVKGSLSMVGTR
jgi:hypothetical protein